MKLLYRLNFYGHLPVQEFGPPNQVLANRRQLDILEAEPARRDQRGKRSGAAEEWVFFDPICKLRVSTIVLVHPCRKLHNTVLE